MLSEYTSAGLSWCLRVGLAESESAGLGSRATGNTIGKPACSRDWERRRERWRPWRAVGGRPEAYAACSVAVWRQRDEERRRSRPRSPGSSEYGDSVSEESRESARSRPPRRPGTRTRRPEKYGSSVESYSYTIRHG